MKNRDLFLSALLVITFSSCTVFSVHPLYDSGNLRTDPRLAGTWKDIGEDETFVKITANLDSSYDLSWYEKGDTTWYLVHYLMIGKDYFLDLFPLDKHPYDGTDLLLKNYVPMHSFLKLEIQNNQAVAYLFDGDKMMSLFRQNRIRLQHELMNDYVIITAKTNDLEKFVQKYSGNKEAFSEATLYRKVVN